MTPLAGFSDDFEISEQYELFLEKASEDPTLLDRLKKGNTVSVVVEIAKEEGFLIRADDIFKSDYDEAEQQYELIGWAFSDRIVYFYLLGSP